MVSCAQTESVVTRRPEVLIVDDNPSVTRALVRLLEHHGYLTVVCHTGTEALAYASRTKPAAAVVDIHLPDICGLTLSKQLRTKFGAEGCPIIVLSGDTSIENLKRLPQAGANYFLSKPFKSEHLVEQLRELAVA